MTGGILALDVATERRFGRCTICSDACRVVRNRAMPMAGFAGRIRRDGRGCDFSRAAGAVGPEVIISPFGAI